jgi:Ribbon-helix-helix protein, copG family
MTILNDRLLQLRVPQALIDQLNCEAEKRLMSRSDYIRVVLMQRLSADGISIDVTRPVNNGEDVA